MDLSTPLRRKLADQFRASMNTPRSREFRERGNHIRLLDAVQRLDRTRIGTDVDAPDPAPLDPADAEALARFLASPRPRWRKGAR